MSLRYILHILFKRKWLVLIALIVAPLVAAGVLIFAEPVFVSRCKLEVYDRSNPNDPMGSTKSQIKDDVFIQRQIELIFTDRVMSRVVDDAKLLPSPPSQSIFARMTGTKTEPSKFPPDRERIELIRALKAPAHVKVDAINPQVMIISTQMNTPELARQVCASVLSAYKKELERIQSEDDQFTTFYTKRLAGIDSAIAECQQEMIDFNRLHPREAVPGGSPLQIPDNVKPGTIQSGRPNGESPTGGDTKFFNPVPAELGPITRLNSEIVERKIELIALKSKYSEENYQYKNLAAKIAEDEKLLEQYKARLSEQQVMAVQWTGLQSKMDSLRQQRQKINEDLLKQKNADMANSTMATIKIQDDPTFDPQPIYPKKVMILLASIFIGLMLGLALAYIAHVLDSTYHLPEDFYSDTGIPVLAAIPFDKSLAV